MTTLPDSLVRFRGELELAIARRQQAARRRRPLVRLAVAAVVAAAVAVGTLTALPGERLVEPASAAQRAAAVLTAAPGSVVHVKTLVEQRNADGSRTSWRTESWQDTTPPYEVRQVVTGAASGGATPAPATAEPLREQVLDLLRSGKLTESGRSSAGGRELVSFTWADGQTRYEYTVEAGTFEPVRWRFAPADGSGETTVTFETYEVLPGG